MGEGLKIRACKRRGGRARKSVCESPVQATGVTKLIVTWG